MLAPRAQGTGCLVLDELNSYTWGTCTQAFLLVIYGHLNVRI